MSYLNFLKKIRADVNRSLRKKDYDAVNVGLCIIAEHIADTWNTVTYRQWCANSNLLSQFQNEMSGYKQGYSYISYALRHAKGYPAVVDYEDYEDYEDEKMAYFRLFIINFMIGKEQQCLRSKKQSTAA